MSFVAQQLQQVLSAQTGVKRWWVGLSGGLDSTVLVACLAQLRLPQPICCVHVHHGLSEFADSWQQHCADLCKDLGLAFEAHRVEVQEQGQGLEAAARDARYQVFEALLEEGDCLLLAHHQDDQAETLLLRLMRGTGVDGLTGVQSRRSLGAGHLLRPLLQVSRAQLEQQAEAMQLAWVEDDSNTNQRFDRNYLRHQVMPLLEQRWPEFARQWQRTANLAEEASSVLSEVAQADLQLCLPRQEQLGHSLLLEPLMSLSHARRVQLLRLWLQGLNEQKGLNVLKGLKVPVPEKAHIEQIEEQLLHSDVREDAQAQVSWGGVVLRRFAGRLFCLPWLNATPAQCRWDGKAPLRWGDWLLSIEKVSEGGWRLPQQGLTVKARVGGERCRPHWRQHSQTLKKLLQETQVAPWLREQIPLIYSDEQELIAVADRWHCYGWQAEAQQGVVLRWQYLPM